MADSLRKRPRDPNQLAKMLVDIVAGEIEDRPPTPGEQGKDPAAVKRGRLGGIKGGKARAASMTPAAAKFRCIEELTTPPVGAMRELRKKFRPLDRASR